MKIKSFLICVFFFSFLIRLSAASILQRGFDGDEAAFGYYGYSVAKNLSDEYGNKLPLYFPSIGDYKYPVYAYLTAIPVAIFGLSEIATRLISVIAGSLLVIVIYFISIELFKDKRIGFFASFLAAISPYGIMFSSGAYESNLATFFVATGILFFLKNLKTNTRKHIVFAFVFFFLAIFTYSTSRLFLLLFLPLSLLFLEGRFKKMLIPVALFISLIILVSLDIRSRVRAKDVAVFGKNSSATYVANELLGEDSWVFMGRKMKLLETMHGEYVIDGLDVIQNYFEHIEPEYLFLNGNQNMPKYSVPKMGLFYVYEIVTMFFGIIFIAKNNNKLVNIVFLWIIVSPIASSLTIETPNPIRVLVGLPAFVLLSAAGIFYLYDQKSVLRRKLILFVFSGVAAVGMSYFWHQFSIHDVYHRPWYTDGGMKDMVTSVGKMQSDFDKVIIGGDPYIFFLFYNKVSPKDFVANATIADESPGVWERVETYKNIIFKMDVACPKIGRENVLYVCRGNEIPQNSVLHKVITFNDSVPAFTLIEFVPYSKRQTVELPANLKYMEQTDLSFKEGLLSEDSGRYW